MNTHSQPGAPLRSMMESISVATLSTVDEQAVLPPSWKLDEAEAAT